MLHPRNIAPRIRRAHAAIRALNVELVQIRDKVSNEDMGKARMAWYRLSLESIVAGDTHARAPVLDALAETCPHLCGELTSLVDARTEDLGYPNVPVMKSLLRVASNTHGLLAETHSKLLDDKIDSSVARDAGTAVGLVVLLRGAPAHAAARLSYVPRELLGKHGILGNELLAGGPTCAPVYREIADAARALIDKVRATGGDLPPIVRPSLWGLRIADIYLGRLERAGHDPFDPKLRASMASTYPLRLQLSLLAGRFTGRP